ncbi:type IX secretion system membrane protein PorP/SprF [Flavobacteriaceae bacterium F89]|uniref:Type IX secretion system membrane protein PorP/SprF n=1 Tax=Cerina litoralis TaxID=2874477 RepID=A0AAE3ETK7_9FLAO|nr:type IX secretion system membrane protein PorP/SprF [Cerina litoralis]MCG2460210.1 type IX secretion system membrane protein PorP/SprF [Cerina litoralis]
MGKYFCIFFFFIVYRSMGQQEAQYTQFMYNMSIINPAYVVDDPGSLHMGALYRTQWTGVEGAPRTANVFARMPLNEQNEVGINFVNDNIGKVLKENKFSADFAHILSLSRTLKLSLGIKAGVNNLAFDFSNTNVSTDPTFSNTNSTFLTIGAGAFLYSDSFYIGFSSPNFLPKDLDVNKESLYEKSMALYLTGGYVFEVNDYMNLKPSMVIMQEFGAPLSFDVAINAGLYDKFEIGTSYRYQDAVSILAAFSVTKSFKIGYAYDYNIGNELSEFSNGSHEIILLYNLDFLKSRRYTSPRFF